MTPLLLPTTLIHYGSTSYNPKKVRPIENYNWCKPKGGLWTSPEDSKWGWKDFCESACFEKCNKSNSFTLKLNKNVKVFIIDSLSDLKNAPLLSVNIGGSFNRGYLDFELLAKNYDAIWLTENGQGETHLYYPINLYGWDCETVLIMNPYSVSVC